jgi:hypothetical protein
MVQKFWRKRSYRDLLGLCNSEFHEKQKQGLISPPDGWLGARSPFWTDETVEKDQKRLLAAPRPVETRPLRRRRKEADAPESDLLDAPEPTQTRPNRRRLHALARKEAVDSQ